jgi:hypothetical protein
MQGKPGLSNQQDISRNQSSSSLYIIPKEEVSVKIRVLILSCFEHKWITPPGTALDIVDNNTQCRTQGGTSTPPPKGQKKFSTKNAKSNNF